MTHTHILCKNSNRSDFLLIFSSRTHTQSSTCITFDIRYATTNKRGRYFIGFVFISIIFNLQCFSMYSFGFKILRLSLKKVNKNCSWDLTVIDSIKLKHICRDNEANNRIFYFSLFTHIGCVFWRIKPSRNVHWTKSLNSTEHFRIVGASLRQLLFALFSV